MIFLKSCAVQTPLLKHRLVILCVQGVEEQTVYDRPLLVCGSHLQQRRSTQLHTAGFVRWKPHTHTQYREKMLAYKGLHCLNLTKVTSGSHTFSFLEKLHLLWAFWAQWIYKSCPADRNKQQHREQVKKRTRHTQRLNLTGSDDRFLFALSCKSPADCRTLNMRENVYKIKALFTFTFLLCDCASD